MGRQVCAAAAPVLPADLGAVQPQFHAFGRGVGEDVLQGAKPQVQVSWQSEAPGSRQWTDLMDGPGDR